MNNIEILNDICKIQESSAKDYFESKERFFAEMIQAGVEWNFHDHSRTPHGFHNHQLWDIPGICVNALTEGLP